MLAVTVDKIMYDALLAALPVLWGLVHEKGLHPEQKWKRQTFAEDGEEGD